MTLTLDPGHGQYDNKSPINAKYIEGTRMWHLANKLKLSLEQYGIKVITTRPNITDNPSLDARGRTASAYGSDLFLSLHSNASGDSSVRGTELFYSVTKAENKTLADALGEKVSAIMGHSFRGSKTKVIEGTSRDWYGVIRAAAENGCKCAMIIEHGFHTNKEDADFLLIDANLQKIADAEAAVIADYFGVNPEYKIHTVKKGESLWSIAFDYLGDGKRYPEIKALNNLTSDTIDPNWKLKIPDAKIGNYVIHTVKKGESLWSIAYDYLGDGKRYPEIKELNDLKSYIIDPGWKLKIPNVPTTRQEIKVGDTVRLKKNATTYEGVRLASFVYDRNHVVKEIDGDRAVITYNGSVVCAVNVNDLTEV